MEIRNNNDVITNDVISHRRMIISCHVLGPAVLHVDRHYAKQRASDLAYYGKLQYEVQYFNE